MFIAVAVFKWFRGWSIGRTNSSLALVAERIIHKVAKAKPGKLTRTTFEVGRDMEFFTEKELTMQIGHDREWWPIAILKELIDNALDATETAGIFPLVEGKENKSGVSVEEKRAGV